MLHDRFKVMFHGRFKVMFHPMVDSRSCFMAHSRSYFMLNSRSCFIVVHVFVVDSKSCHFYILFSLHKYVKMEHVYTLGMQKIGAVYNLSHVRPLGLIP